MNKIAIVTDSNSGITQKQAKEMGIHVIPMPFTIEGKNFFEDINLTQEEFYRILNEDVNIKTSQPAPADVIELWERLLADYDEIVHIPMSSGLSATCETAMALAREYDGKVQVVDNQRISVTQRQSVLDAMEFVKQGKSAAQIREILEREKLESSIYLMVETLRHLKRGGRITPTAAALGTILNIKPILQVQGEKLDAYAKARGKIKAKKIILDAVKVDLEERFKEPFKEGKIALMVAYAGNLEEGEAWRKEAMEAFPGIEFHIDPVSLSVACHVGPGVLAIACAKKSHLI